MSASTIGRRACHLGLREREVTGAPHTDRRRGYRRELEGVARPARAGGVGPVPVQPRSQRSGGLEVGDDRIGIGVAAPTSGSWPSRSPTAIPRRSLRTGTAACTRTSPAAPGPAAPKASGWPTESATSRSTRSGANDAAIQATAAPQSWPTTVASSTPTWSSTAATPPPADEAVGLDLRRLVGPPVAPLVGNDHPVAGVGQGAHLLGPQPPRVGEAVEEHHRTAVIRPDDLHVEVDARAVDPDASHTPLQPLIVASSRSRSGAIPGSSATGPS